MTQATRKLRIRSATIKTSDGEVTLMQGDDVPAKLVDKLDESALEPVEQAEPAAEQPTEPEPLGEDATDEQLAGAKVEPLLTWVGDDKDRAGRVLALERAKGDKARSTLVEKLEATTAAS